MGVGEGLNKSQFLITDGLILFAKLGEMGLIERGIFGGQQDGAAGSPVFRAFREEVALPSSEVGP